MLQINNGQNLTKEEHPALELRNISKTFRTDKGTDVKALEDINLNIYQGQFVTLLGATGCGKSTLLNLIAGLEIPDDGSLSYGDDLYFGKNIAYVSQQYTLFPWRTTLKNVSFGLQMRGLPHNDRKNKSLELLEKVGLGGFEKAYPHELSGGMRQRAAIAQALVIEPKLLLMDEPFGALDDSTRTELQQMLITLWQESHPTILFVTHNIDEALLLGDRVVVFSQRPGKIIREYQINLPRPRNRMTEEFTNLFINIRKSLSFQLD